MRCFHWISPRPLPLALDLGRRGWRRCDGQAEATGCARIIDAIEWDQHPETFPAALRSSALALGVAESAGRARWLAAGFADALGPDIRLDELEFKAARVLGERPATMLGLGRLELDLVLRDARIDSRRVRLNPREFALLWRLAEARGAPVSRRVLLRDVFDLGFDPGTNRVAVHICRLRKKLAEAGLATLLVTGPGDGAYRLILPRGEPAMALAQGLQTA